MKIVNGDVLKVQTGIICHSTNCLGVMGSGIAKQIREQFPSAYEVYKKQQAERGLILGEISFARVGELKYIVNANCQQQTGSGKQTSYDAVHDAFLKIRKLHDKLCEYHDMGKIPIVFPAFGAGLGGGSWPVIEAIIEDILPSQEYDTTLFLFNG